MNGPSPHRVGLRALACFVLAGCLLAGPAGAQTFEPLDDFGGEAFGPGRLGEFAGDTAVDSDGNVWVVDDGNRRVLKYTFGGEFVTAVGAPTLSEPAGIGADERGSVYVADRGLDRVVKLDNGGNELRRIGAAGLGALDVAVAGTTVYVAGGAGIARFTTSGKRRAPLTNTPVRRIAIAGARVVATHGIDPRAVIFSRTGKLVRQFGGAPEFSGTLQGIAGTSDSIYISYLGDGEVGRYNLDGALQGRFGAGTLTALEGVAADCRNNVYVVDSRASTMPPPATQSHVLKFGDPAASPPPCAPPPPLPTTGFAVQVDDVEVLQAVQYDGDFRQGRDEQGFQFPAAGYGSARHRRAVGLAAGRATVVRVYASLLNGPRGGLAGVPAQLRVSRSGDLNSIRDVGTLTPIAAPALLRTGDGLVNTARRADPSGAYTFMLPPDWAQGVLSFEARVNPAHVGCATRSCEHRGAFVLSKVPFSPTIRLPVSPLALIVQPVGAPATLDESIPADPAPLFERARAMLPLPVDVSPYRAVLGVRNPVLLKGIRVETCTLLVFCDEEAKTYTNEDRGSLLVSRVEAWNKTLPRGRSLHVPFGLLGQKWSSRVRSQAHGTLLSGSQSPAGIAVGGRPIRTVAHELVHGLGLLHASDACGGGGGNPDFGEDWPPDQRGLLGGLGIDPTPGSGRGRGPFRILAPGARGEAEEFFDLMSYCGGSSDDNAWISPRNWQRLLRFRAPPGPAPPPDPPVATAQARQRVDVRAVLLADGSVLLTHVERSSGAPPALVEGSPSGYVLRGVNEAGAQVTEAPVSATTLGDSGTTVLEGSIDAAGLSGVLVGPTDPALSAARRMRSANAPTVRVLAPRRGARLRGRRIELSWRASDRDGDALTADVRVLAGRRPQLARTHRRLLRPAAAPAGRHAHTLAAGADPSARERRLQRDDRGVRPLQRAGRTAARAHRHARPGAASARRWHAGPGRRGLYRRRPQAPRPEAELDTGPSPRGLGRVRAREGAAAGPRQGRPQGPRRRPHRPGLGDRARAACPTCTGTALGAQPPEPPGTLGSPAGSNERPRDAQLPGTLLPSLHQGAPHPPPGPPGQRQPATGAAAAGRRAAAHGLARHRSPLSRALRLRSVGQVEHAVVVGLSWPRARACRARRPRERAADRTRG